MRTRPLRNRVTATGEIVADPVRGLFMGNRGILHDLHGQMGHATWRHKAWIICVLKWKDWHRDVMQPGAYTELFFLDEAVALAAGHRPCALCRRPAFDAYVAAAGHTGSAPELDQRLHSERAIPRKFRQRRHEAPFADLPDGAIVHHENRPALVSGKVIRPLSLSGYGEPVKRPSTGSAVVLTPETSIRAIRGGYTPVLHPSAT